MECLFVDNNVENENEWLIENPEEVNHIKALRLRDNHKIMVTNGKGFGAVGRIIFHNKQYLFMKEENLSFRFNENNNDTGILLCWLDNRDRMEFAIEKSVELGVSDIFIFKSKFSSQKEISSDRLNKKIIASVKQCKRTILPTVTKINQIEELIKSAKKFKNIILADVNGIEMNNLIINDNALILIGPEGGFDIPEIEFFRQNLGITTAKLGNRRLRAETAAISGLSLINFKLNNF